VGVLGALQDLITRRFTAGVGEKSDGLGNRTWCITTSLDGYVRLNNRRGFPEQPEASREAGHTCPPVMIHALKASDTTTEPDAVTPKMTDGIYNSEEGKRTGMKVRCIASLLIMWCLVHELTFLCYFFFR